MTIKYNYKAKGYVLGKFWGGGMGYYPAKTYSDSSLARLKTKIRKDFESGALDSGMGYEELTGTIMYINVISSRKLGRKIYTNNDKIITFKLGKISETKLENAVGHY